MSQRRKIKVVSMSEIFRETYTMMCHRLYGSEAEICNYLPPYWVFIAAIIILIAAFIVVWKYA